MFQNAKEAKLRWPAFWQFMAAAFNQDFDIVSGSLEGARDRAIVDLSTQQRLLVTREWWDWNSKAGAVQDIRPAMDELGIDLCFEDAAAARRFMNWIYDGLIVAVRSEAGKDWKP